MTVEQLVKDGQLQVESLKAVLGRDELRASKPCIVLVVDEDVTMTRLFMDGFEGERNTNRCIMPLLGGALAEFAKRAMQEDAAGLEAMGKFFALGRKGRALNGGIGALLAALDGKEANDEQ